jgi:hypothetical protein
MPHFACNFSGYVRTPAELLHHSAAHEAMSQQHKMVEERASWAKRCSRRSKDQRHLGSVVVSPARRGQARPERRSSRLALSSRHAGEGESD